MGVVAEDHGLDRSSTESLFSPLAIHTTLPWTELTIFQDGVGLFNPLNQSTFHLEFFIGRNPSNLFLLFGMQGRRREEQ
jgi:hypothetical protein